MDPASLYKSLSDQTRLRCIALLVENQELCVCELIHALNLPQPKISHHLGILRKAGLVSDRKDGLWIYYQLNQELPQWVMSVLKTTIEGIKIHDPFATDANELCSMPNRPGAACSA